ncbi:MAG: sigma-54 dependent transcriptional regulator [Thermodesulfobacteriota bacterium]
MKSILLVTTSRTVHELVRASFDDQWLVEFRSGREAALQALQKKPFDFLFIELDLLAPPANTDIGMKAAMQPFWLVAPSINIIVLCQQQSVRQAVLAVKNGAANYLSHPLNRDEIRYVVESIFDAILSQSELAYLRDQFWRAEALQHIATKNPVMETVFEKVKSVAPTGTTVLLVGETGTGKGVLAKLIHNHSTRRGNQFISVHCGAIPDTLIESELFGHERGAFTGATRRKLGKFELARDGTIFLDEISTITAPAQIKMLQVLQEKSFSRVGGEEEISTNARIIAASNADLEEMVRAGAFRRDLFYRLNVFPIHIPPLRERREDIPHFIEVFLDNLNRFNAKEIHGVQPAVLEALARYDWPGNIRELENLVERAYILESSTVLTPASFPAELFRSRSAIPMVKVDSADTLAEVRRRGVEDIERCYLGQVLATHHGRIAKAAAHAGITSRQLHKLMKKHGIRKEDFKGSPTPSR